MLYWQSRGLAKDGQAALAAGNVTEATRLRDEAASMQAQGDALLASTNPRMDPLNIHPDVRSAIMKRYDPSAAQRYISTARKLEGEAEDLAALEGEGAGTPEQQVASAGKWRSYVSPGAGEVLTPAQAGVIRAGTAPMGAGVAGRRDDIMRRATERITAAAIPVPADLDAALSDISPFKDKTPALMAIRSNLKSRVKDAEAVQKKVDAEMQKRAGAARSTNPKARDAYEAAKKRADKASALVNMLRGMRDDPRLNEQGGRGLR